MAISLLAPMEASLRLVLNMSHKVQGHPLIDSKSVVDYCSHTNTTRKEPMAISLLVPMEASRRVSV